MRTLISLALICSTAIAAPVPKELKRDPFVGKWSVKQTCYNGRKTAWVEGCVFFDINNNYVLTTSFAKPAVDNSAVVALSLNMAFAIAITFDGKPIQLEFDPAQKDIEFGTTAGNRALVGKYNLEGDTMTICLSLHGFPRPSTIEARENTIVWTLNLIAK